MTYNFLRQEQFSYGTTSFTHRNPIVLPDERWYHRSATRRSSGLPPPTAAAQDTKISRYPGQFPAEARVIFWTDAIEFAIVFIKAPLPCVACHIVEMIAVGWEAADRCCPLPLIRSADIAEVRIAVCYYITIRVSFASQTPACGVFPFCFGRQPFMCPRCVSNCIRQFTRTTGASGALNRGLCDSGG